MQGRAKQGKTADFFLEGLAVASGGIAAKYSLSCTHTHRQPRQSAKVCRISAPLHVTLIRDAVASTHPA